MIVSIGWSTLPRALDLNTFKVVQKDDKEALGWYNISWEPPSYVGGLNLTDIKYNVTIRIGASIGANITSDTHYIIPFTLHDKNILYKTLKLSVEVHVVFTQVNSTYLPGNMYTKATYNTADLIETTIG